MRRTWVSSSRDELRRRRKSLNALGLEQLEDRLTLSASTATVLSDVEILSPAALAALDAQAAADHSSPADSPTSFGDQAGPFFSADRTGDFSSQSWHLTGDGDKSLVNAYTNQFAATTGSLSTPLAAVGGGLAPGSFTGVTFASLPDVFTRIDITSAPTTTIVTDGGLVTGLATFDGITLPVGNQVFASAATIGINTASGIRGAEQSRDIDIVRLGLPVGFQSLDPSGAARTEFFVLSEIERAMFHLDIDMMPARMVDMAAMHGADVDRPPPGPSKSPDVTFQNIFSVRDQFLSQTRPDGSTRLQPMTNFAADSYFASPAAVGQRTPATPWVADGPTTMQVATDGRDGAAGRRGRVARSARKARGRRVIAARGSSAGFVPSSG